MVQAPANGADYAPHARARTLAMAANAAAVCGCTKSDADLLRRALKLCDGTETTPIGGLMDAVGRYLGGPADHSDPRDYTLLPSEDLAAAVKTYIGALVDEKPQRQYPWMQRADTGVGD